MPITRTSKPPLSVFSLDKVRNTVETCLWQFSIQFCANQNSFSRLTNYNYSSSDTWCPLPSGWRLKRSSFADSQPYATHVWTRTHGECTPEPPASWRLQFFCIHTYILFFSDVSTHALKCCNPATKKLGARWYVQFPTLSSLPGRGNVRFIW